MSINFSMITAYGFPLDMTDQRQREGAADTETKFYRKIRKLGLEIVPSGNHWGSTGGFFVIDPGTRAEFKAGNCLRIDAEAFEYPPDEKIRPLSAAQDAALRNLATSLNIQTALVDWYLITSVT